MDHKNNKEPLKHGSFVVNFSAISLGLAPSMFLTTHNESRTESLNHDRKQLDDTNLKVNEHTCYIVLRIRVLNKDSDVKHWGLCSELVTRPLLVEYKRNDHGIASCLLNHTETLPLYLMPNRNFCAGVQESSSETNRLFQSYKFLVCIGASIVRDGKVFCLGYGSRVLRAIDLFGKRLSATIIDSECDDIKANTSMLFFDINVKDVEWVPSDYIAMLKDYSHRKEDSLKETNMSFLIPDINSPLLNVEHSPNGFDSVSQVDDTDLLSHKHADDLHSKKHKSCKLKDLHSNHKERHAPTSPNKTFQCLIVIKNESISESESAQPLEKILGDILKSLYTANATCSAKLNMIWVQQNDADNPTTSWVANNEDIFNIQLTSQIYTIALLLDLDFNSADVPIDVLKKMLDGIKSMNKDFRIVTAEIGKYLKDTSHAPPNQLEKRNSSINHNYNERKLEDINNVVRRTNVSNSNLDTNPQFSEKYGSLTSLLSMSTEKGWALMRSKIHNLKSSQGDDAIKFIWPQIL